MHRSNPPNRLTHKDKASERREAKDEGHTEYMSEKTKGKECASERREAEDQ